MVTKVNSTVIDTLGNLTVTGTTTLAAVNSTGFINTSGNVVATAGTFNNLVVNTGNINAVGGFFVGNGFFLTGIVSGGGSYSNVQVATYLPTYSGNVANIRLGVSGVLTFADGTTQITAGGGSYSNVQVAAFLPTYSGVLGSSNLQVTGGGSFTGTLTVGAGGFINSGGNILATDGILNSLTVNGNISAGNISARFANIYSTGSGVGTMRLAGLPADQRWQLVAVNGLGTASEGTMYARFGAGFNPVTGGAIESHIDFRLGPSLGTGYMVFNTGSTPLFYANSNQVNIIATTVSNSTSSGALVVAGGVGIAGNVNVGNNLTVQGNITGNVSGFSIGYRDLPQVIASNVTLALADASEHFYANTGAPTTITVPSNANVAFPIGTTIVIVNRGAGNVTIQNQGAGAPFLYLAGNATTTTSRTLTQYGMATLLKTETNLWFVNGTGLV